MKILTNVFLIKSFEGFVPEYFVINDTFLQVLVLPKIFKNNFTKEISYIAYENIQFYLLIGWLVQFILIFLYILINNFKTKIYYARKQNF